MKKMLIVSLFAMAAAVANAKEATIVERTYQPSGCMSEWTPLKLTLVGPVALPWGSWDVKGLEVGVWNDTLKIDGLQVGVVNITDGFRGLQIGAINVTRNAYGFQVGVVNVITSNDIPFLPILNCYF